MHLGFENLINYFGFKYANNILFIIHNVNILGLKYTEVNNFFYYFCISFYQAL